MAKNKKNAGALLKYISNSSVGFWDAKKGKEGTGSETGNKSIAAEKNTAGYTCGHWMADTCTPLFAHQKICLEKNTS